MILRKYLFDQLSPVALYGEIKKKFSNEISILLESVVVSENGNFSFIALGAKERLIYKDKKSIYTDKSGKSETLNIDPFKFLQNYYQKIDKSIYKEISKKAGFSFVDGFIGFIGYDMVKVFEPTLHKFMDNLNDSLKKPDLDLIRPKVIVVYSHKSSTLTLLDPDGSNTPLIGELL